MAEEQRWQEPGGHRLCANNCGFFGSPTTLDLCSKCYKDHCLKEQQTKAAKMAMEKTLQTQSESTSYSSSSSSPSSSFPESQLPINSPENQKGESSNSIVVADNVTLRTTTTAQPNRCATCWRRVGLTGFKCRCGITFCGSHRYPEQHGCTFDYKAVGREEIAKANPVVKAEKLDKI